MGDYDDNNEQLQMDFCGVGRSWAEGRETRRWTDYTQVEGGGWWLVAVCRMVRVRRDAEEGDTVVKMRLSETNDG